VTAPITRREFIKVSSLAGGGLLLTIWLPGCTSDEDAATTTSATSTTTTTTAATTTSETTTTTTVPGDPDARVTPSIYVAIDGTGAVTITAFRSEMGQGVRTAIAMILAEELDAGWDSVRIDQAPADGAYGNQVTGGSVSVSDHYSVLRAAGATARRLLIETAAALWEVDPDDCITDAGRVVHPDGVTAATYGALAEAAAEREVPSGVRGEKDPGDFRIIGTPLPLYDTPDIVTGAAVYASDVTLPGMRYAAIARCPTFGGRPASFRSGPALAVPGVLEVVEISSGIAVAAEHTWAAIRGRDALEVEWTPGGNAGVTDTQIRAGLVERMSPVDDGVASADYFVPYEAHQAMEPMCCVADATGGRCEVWAPTQHPQDAQRRAAQRAGLGSGDVVVHVPLIGGRFGRGHHNDMVDEAVEVSRLIGAPVKVVWTREDDTRHDVYHPMGYARAWERPGTAPGLQLREAGTPIPTGYWRSVGNFPRAFATACFIDELAHAAGRDPLEVHREHAPAEARPCIDLAAERAGWGSALSAGRGRGFAYHATWGVTHVAQIAEASVAEERIRVHRVVCAVDCGTVVNPDTVRAQMEGGIVFGLSAALYGGVSIDNGAAVQGNFTDLPILRFDEMPEVEVHIVPSTDSPHGIGEMGVPPIAPAVANAVFAATGRRLRSLPLRLDEAP